MHLHVRTGPAVYCALSAAQKSLSFVFINHGSRNVVPRIDRQWQSVEMPSVSRSLLYANEVT